jgi:hypothetical protein
MPRPQISTETLGVINEIVAKYSDFSPSELSTESKIKYVIQRTEDLKKQLNQRNQMFR